MRELEPTVFIVDDDAPVLKGLEALLLSVRVRTEIYLSAEDFFRDYTPIRPGCLILDVRMPRIGGIEVYRRLRQEGSDIPVIFMTGHTDIATAVAAMREGAFDFLEKPFNDQYLIDRVHAALAWDRENRGRNAERNAVATRLKALSPRELEVIDHLMAGQTSKTIAWNLGVGVKTVDFHRANIMRKTGAETTAELVCLLLEGGYSIHRRSSRSPRRSPAVV